jgi:hypothetical protein
MYFLKWKDVDTKRLFDLKLKCIFDFGGEGAENQKSTNTSTVTNDIIMNLSTYQQAESDIKLLQK